MAGKTVVVLGAGTGGLVAANRLRRMLDKGHRVVLIDRSPVYTFAPSLTWVMLGERTVPQISRDLRKLEKKGIEFKAAEVTGFDFDNKRVLLSTGQVVYDYLVVSLGVDYMAEDVPGLHRAWSFYHADGAEGLRDALKEFRGGRVAVVVPSLPYRCPPAPYEGAMMLEHHFRKRKVRGEVEITVITPEGQPLLAAGEEVGERILDLLKERSIGFSGGRTAKSVNQEKRLVNFAEGEPEGFDLLIATPVHKLPGVVVETPLVNGGGWIPVDRETMQTAVPDVYAIGDVTMIPLANGHYLPKAGVFAHGEAEVVARNLASEIAGKEPIWAYGGQGACFLETGGGRGAYVTGRFYAEPDPEVALRTPGRMWHWAKLGFERVWLWRWF
ncbi:MAG TPA: FAD/NAD(P)-binding oxidoreductase [Dehalococcoidia bacterium]|nr:FAD/NAD(P)-binding oxidoreductase [Dehalococcoidia bacterium]